MSTTSLTSKGQITIPLAVREALQVSTGDRVEFVRVAPGRYEFIAATIMTFDHAATTHAGMQLIQ